MYMETTHGYYDALLVPFDANKSILPMNINTEYWGDTWGTREQLKQIYPNILAGARLLKSIQANLPTNSSITQFATLYNQLNRTRVTDYGARVAEIYKTQPWIN